MSEEMVSVPKALLLRVLEEAEASLDVIENDRGPCDDIPEERVAIERLRAYAR